jgi:Flp pilus assembly protein TadD
MRQTKELKAAGPGPPANVLSQQVVAYAVYYLILLGMLLAPLYVGQRIWGFNHWAYYPGWVPALLCGAGAVLPLILSVRRKGSIHKRQSWLERPSADTRFLFIYIFLSLGFLAAFILLRGTTHFLGDGYQLLANLAAENPIVKDRNLGTMLAHQLIYSLLTGDPAHRALLSYQLLSWGGGLVFLLLVYTLSRRLLSTLTDRLLLSLGLLSGGYMLLFFGYVEHYSLFIPAVGLFAFVGLLIIRRGISRWYLLPPLVLAILLHIFGLALVPAAVYLLISGTRVSAAWSGLGWRIRLLVAILVVAGLLAGLYSLWSRYYFVRFAFVPWFPDEFTVEGYTLFSSKHLVDLFNLVYLLLPSLPLFIVMAIFAPLKKIFSERDAVFLLVMATVFVLDPKLGMPRDWDLFAFCGVPLALLGYLITIKSRTPPGSLIRFVGVTIFLNFAVLIPRAIGRSVEVTEPAHVETYIRLDSKRNLNLIHLVSDQYLQRGDSARADYMFWYWQENFPEIRLNRQGLNLWKDGRFAESIPFFEAALKENPMLAAAYSNLGECYLNLGEYDQALAALEISEGMNAHNPQTIRRLGMYYQQRGEINQAEKYFRRAISFDSDNMAAYQSLFELYSSTGQLERHSDLLVDVASRPEASSMIDKLLGDHYLSRGLLDQAEQQYREAIGKGLDSVTLRGLLERFPQLME